MNQKPAIGEKLRMANSITKTDTSRHKNKRNFFQKSLDRKLAVELLSQGKTYTEVTAAINSERSSYSLSRQQVMADVGKIQEELIASAMNHGLEVIAEELDKIENLSIDISRRIGAFPDSDPRVAPLLKQMESLAARKTYLTGGDNFIRAQDINLSISKVISMGYEISEPGNQIESTTTN
jgi:hypothetical protein